MGGLYQESKTAKNEAAQLDALYEIGERAIELADLMTRDKESHGSIDPSLCAIIERRLKEYGVTINVDARGYHYDLKAFLEYVRRAPNGNHAVDARYVLVGFDDPGDDVSLLTASVTAKERFIRSYPKFDKIPIVKFMLAQQHVRLAKVYANQKKDALSAQQRRIAENLYREIIRLYPNSPEADPAADYLNAVGAKR
jgi:hypothetical protein